VNATDNVDFANFFMLIILPHSEVLVFWKKSPFLQKNNKTSSPPTNTSKQSYKLQTLSIYLLLIL
ncbi:MAG: hypothetical protein V3U75_05055, partial [Methylococcaceae bacterium]